MRSQTPPPARLPERLAAAWGQCGLRVQCAAIHRQPAGRAFQRMANDFYRFWHVIEGRIAGEHAGGRIDAGPGTGIILPPNRSFLDHEADLGRGVAVLICLFQLNVPAGAMNPLLWLSLPAAVPAAVPHAAADLCAAIDACSPTWRSDWPTRCALRPAIDRLLQQHLADGCAAGIWDATPAVPGWLLDLRQLAARRLTSPGLGASNLHRLADRSREHVSRALRRHYGVGAAGFLKMLRIELAARLLAQGGDDAVAEIAARVGYRDQSLFTRHFRALHRMTPTAWRRAVRSGGSPGDDPDPHHKHHKQDKQHHQ